MGKTLDFIVRTFKQAPDANICALGLIGITVFGDENLGNNLIQFGLGFWTIKQYLFGHLGYCSTKKAIENGKEVEALYGAPCLYFGNRYAIKKHAKIIEL